MSIRTRLVEAVGLGRRALRESPAPTGEPLGDVTRFVHPVLPSHELATEPRRVILAGRAYVLFRDGAGKPAALVDACPHRKAPLSAGRMSADGRLVCGYHGWRFDGAGVGSSPTQPGLTRCDATSMQVIERFGHLWLTARNTAPDHFPSLEEESFEFAGSYAMTFEAPLHVVLDNFSEDEHTPWVHTRLGWNESRVGEVEFEAHNFEDRTEVAYRAPQRASFLAPLLMLRPGDVFHNEWVTRFDPVRTIYTIYWTNRSGRRRPVITRSAIFFVPETARRTRLHVFTFVRFADPRYRVLAPLVKRAALFLGRAEIDDDRRFIPVVADTPAEVDGMRLGRYDKPLIHNRRLLHRLYWNLADQDTSLPSASAAR